MMKILSGAAILASTLAAPAFANTASTVIYTQIAPVCQITSPGTTAVALSGQTALGGISLQCNNAGGFTASASSLHQGVLADQGNTANHTTYNYTLNVDQLGAVPLTGSGTSINFPAGTAQFLNAQTFQTAVNVTGANGPAFAGTYQDTISFTITAN